MLSIYPTKKYHRDGFHPGPVHTFPLVTFVLVTFSGAIGIGLMVAFLMAILLTGFKLPI